MIVPEAPEFCTCRVPYTDLYRPRCPVHGVVWAAPANPERRHYDSAEPMPILITPPPLPPLPLPPKETPSIDFLMGYMAGIEAAITLSGKQNAD